MTDVTKLMGDKNLLTQEDVSDALHDRSQIVAQELMNYCAKVYRPTQPSSVVSLALLTVSVLLAREFSEGDVDKETFQKKAGEVWDSLVAVKL